MVSSNAKRRARRQRRSGLAPFEAVVSLPLLLFVAALIVNIGVMAAWRVRGEIVSRDEVWRARYPRDGSQESPTPTWPRTARTDVEDDAVIGGLDHPAVQHTVVRGPLPNHFQVLGTLAPNRGEERGVSEISRQFPLLAKLGQYESGEILHPLLDLKWSCHEMSIPNIFRRSKRIYVLPATDQRLPAAMARAAEDMFSIPHYRWLYVLDRDEDILKYRGRYVDFHPWIRHPYPPARIVDLTYCRLDRQLVYDEQVIPLVDSWDSQGRIELGTISQLPRRLTSFFLNMYQQCIEQLKDQIDEARKELNRIPGPTMERRRELIEIIRLAEQEIARLEPYIPPLEAYRDRLGDIEAELRAQAEDYLNAVGPRP